MSIDKAERVLGYAPALLEPGRAGPQLRVVPGPPRRVQQRSRACRTGCPGSRAPWGSPSGSSRRRSLVIAVTGAAGFIGSNLVWRAEPARAREDIIVVDVHARRRRQRQPGARCTTSATWTKEAFRAWMADPANARQLETALPHGRLQQHHRDATGTTWPRTTWATPGTCAWLRLRRRRPLRQRQQRRHLRRRQPRLRRRPRRPGPARAAEPVRPLQAGVRSLGAGRGGCSTRSSA